MNDKWNKRYLKLADEIATWSKDPSSQIGSIAVKDGRVLVQGYNGFPRGVLDTEERLENRETKYRYIVHAEQNMIYNATYYGISLKGSSIYVSGLPTCSECAKGLAQVGVKEVFIWKKEYPEKWEKSWEQTKQLFDEVGIKYYYIEEK